MPDTPHLRIVPGATPELSPLPHSIEAEQQILGAILVGNAVVDRLNLEPEDFYDPVHAYIFEVAAAHIRAGHIASPVTLKVLLGGHPGLAELGGPAYLVRLAAAAISTFAASDYARMVRKLRRRRDLIAAVDCARDGLMDATTDTALVVMALEEALVAGVERADTAPVSFSDAATTAVQKVDDAWRGLEAPGVPSRVPELDRLITRFEPGDLILLAGRPSMGKTGIALSIAMRAARAGHPVVFASLEMMPDGLAIRALAEEAAGRPNAVAYAQARKGEMTPDQYRNFVHAAEDLLGAPLWFLPRSCRSLGALHLGAKQVIARAPRYVPEAKMPLVVIDHLGLMKPPAGLGTNRVDHVTALSGGLKEIAMHLGVPVLALSQLSRQVESREDKRPQLSDLRDSGALEQDADTVLFAYRSEYYLAREEPDPGDLDDHAHWQQAMEKVRHRAEIIVAKQRQGEIGTARVRFNPALNLLWSEGDR